MTLEHESLLSMKKMLKVTLWVVGALLGLAIGLIVIAATVMPAPEPKEAEPVVAASSPAAQAEVEPTPAPSTTQPAPASTAPPISPTSAPATTAQAAAPTTAPAKTFADQIREDVGSYSNLISGAEQPEPGRIEVGTSIVDPRGEDGSAPARQALGICQRIHNSHPDAQRITVFEQDGTTFVLYGHPSYGNTCTEV